MSDETNPIHSMLSGIREEAWARFPLRLRLAVRFVWFRRGVTPMWVLTRVDDPSDPPRPFDIVGGMWFYAVASDIAAAAPREVLLSIYGCFFAHTSRFWRRSGSEIQENGNEDVCLLPSWPESTRLAARYQFDAGQIERWLASPFNPRNAQSL